MPNFSFVWTSILVAVVENAKKHRLYPTFHYWTTWTRGNVPANSVSRKVKDRKRLTSSAQLLDKTYGQTDSKNRRTWKKEHWPCCRIFRDILIKLNDASPDLWEKLFQGTKTGTGFPKHLEWNFRPVLTYFYVLRKQKRV